MRYALAIALALAAPALAQPQSPPDPALLQKAIGVLQAQRNAAADGHAAAEARAALLAEELEKVKKELADLKKVEPEKKP